MQPMTFDPSRPCRRYVDILTHREWPGCANCARPRVTDEDAPCIDPVGAWIDATHYAPGHCRERIALLSEEQMRCVDEMSNHAATVPANCAVQHPAELGASSGTPNHTKDIE